MSNNANPLQTMGILGAPVPGYPFLTMEGATSKPVTPGHAETPDASAPEASKGPNQTPKRPQDAPTSEESPWPWADHYEIRSASPAGMLPVATVARFDDAQRIARGIARKTGLASAVVPRRAEVAT